LFLTKVKAATAIISSDQALDSLIRLRSPTKSAGQAVQQLDRINCSDSRVKIQSMPLKSSWLRPIIHYSVHCQIEITADWRDSVL